MPTLRAVLTAVAVIGIAGAGFVLTGCAAEAQSDSLAARVQRLEDREAIRALLLSYGRAVDRHDFNAFSALFSLALPSPFASRCSTARAISMPIAT